MYGWRAKLGLLIPANNTVIEPELQSSLPEGVSLHATRMIVEVPFDGDALIRMEQNAARGIQELTLSQTDVQVYACMATSLVKGRAWTDEFAQRLHGSSSDTAMLTAAGATMEALRALRAKRVAVLSPYPSTIHPLLQPFFGAYGLDVTANLNLELSGYVEVTQQDPKRIYRKAREMQVEGAEALCILATDLPTFPIIEQLERDLGLPVVSTNQAILWQALREAGIHDPLDGLGLLLRDYA